MEFALWERKASENGKRSGALSSAMWAWLFFSYSFWCLGSLLAIKVLRLNESKGGSCALWTPKLMLFHLIFWQSRLSLMPPGIFQFGQTSQCHVSIVNTQREEGQNFVWPLLQRDILSYRNPQAGNNFTEATNLFAANTPRPERWPSFLCDLFQGFLPSKIFFCTAFLDVCLMFVVSWDWKVEALELSLVGSCKFCILMSSSWRFISENKGNASHWFEDADIFLSQAFFKHCPYPHSWCLDEGCQKGNWLEKPQQLATCPSLQMAKVLLLHCLPIIQSPNHSQFKRGLVLFDRWPGAAGLWSVSSGANSSLNPQQLRAHRA